MSILKLELSQKLLSLMLAARLLLYCELDDLCHGQAFLSECSSFFIGLIAFTCDILQSRECLLQQ
jgi:hypothetical protein